jgi:RNA 2',3'-cyclic 3'-phosphodiesterase
MSSLRTFIAIEIPAEIKKALIQQSADLRRAVGRSVRWVTPENIHLTLKFLGEISPANVEMLTQTLKAEASQTPGFEIKMATLGAFPNPRRPRILWVGLTAPETLSRLQHGLETATARLGYPPEDKPFSPHLTIGRVRDQISAEELQALRAALENKNIGALGTFTAQAVQLYKSDLQPGGSIYTCLFTARLGNNANRV